MTFNQGNLLLNPLFSRREPKLYIKDPNSQVDQAPGHVSDVWFARMQSFFILILVLPCATCGHMT